MGPYAVADLAGLDIGWATRKRKAATRHPEERVPTYIDRVDRGHIVPGAPFEIVQESATTTVINGNWGFGYVVNERAMNITIEKAKKANVAAATVYHQSHVGRAASYPIMAADQGMIAMMTATTTVAAVTQRSVATFPG